MTLSTNLFLKQCLVRTGRNCLRTQSVTMVAQTRYLATRQQQEDLPRLPVPPLHDTLNKFLKSSQPLITPEEFNITKEIVSKFGSPGGIGEKLQKILEDRAAVSENWLSDWWINAAYLDFRLPVVVWSSPGLVFPLQDFNCLQDQLKYASKLICGALDYKTMVDENTIPIEKMGGEALDMSQYLKVFGTCRIPGVTRDSITFYGQLKPSPTHIVVVHNHFFFRVDVYGKDGKPLSYKQILQQLRNIVDRSTHAGVPVGILSTQNRNVWGKLHKKLRKDKLNNETLEDIQSSIFLVCLDGPIHHPTDNKMTNAALQCIHGNGLSDNAGNRWYDKTIQFVIGKKGEVGLTYEHSPAEGPPIANLMDHIVDYVEANETEKNYDSIELSRPKRLMFNVSSDIQDEIVKAKTALDSIINDLEMTCFVFDGFGKNFIKSQKMSPDSFIQMAMQLAFFRIHKEPAAHYESASLRKFLHGRTETIRSCSTESVAFCNTFLSDSATNQEKVATLREAVRAHKNFAANAVSGLGIDRHLLGLKFAATENGLDVPKLFLDVAYIKSSHMRLSTSQVPARCKAFMCYGPLVPDGYGCCYNPQDNSMVFGTSAWNSSPETHSTFFKKALEQSLMDIYKVLTETSLQPKL